MATRVSQNPIVCPGHSRPIVELNFSTPTPDGLFLVSASKDGYPMLRNGTTGDWIGTFEGHKGAVWSATLDSHALYAATGSADFTARIWDAVTGDERLQFQHKHIVRAVRFSNDRQILATGGMEKFIRLFDIGNYDKAPTDFPVLSSGIQKLLWTSNDTILLCTCMDTKGIFVWDSRNKEIIKTLETPEPVTFLECSWDGSTLTSADDTTVRFWDAETLNLKKSIDVGFKVFSASYSSKCNKFVVGGEDMSVRLFDYETGSELEKNSKHHGPVHTIQFESEGKTYASGSEDGTIRLWETVPENTRPMLQMPPDRQVNSSSGNKEVAVSQTG